MKSNTLTQIYGNTKRPINKLVASSTSAQSVIGKKSDSTSKKALVLEKASKAIDAFKASFVDLVDFEEANDGNNE